MVTPEYKRSRSGDKSTEGKRDRRLVRPFNEGERDFFRRANLRLVNTSDFKISSVTDRDRIFFARTDPFSDQSVQETISNYNEVAFHAAPNEFFLAGSNGKTLKDQEAMLQQENERLRHAGISTLRWVIPSIPEAVRVIGSSPGKDLFFGDKLSRQIRTRTRLSDHKTDLTAVVSRGDIVRPGVQQIAILAWEANGSSRSLAVVPILVPTSRPGEGFGEIRG